VDSRTLHGVVGVASYCTWRLILANRNLSISPPSHQSSSAIGRARVLASTISRACSVASSNQITRNSPLVHVPPYSHAASAFQVSAHGVFVRRILLRMPLNDDGGTAITQRRVGRFCNPCVWPAKQKIRWPLMLGPVTELFSRFVCVFPLARHRLADQAGSRRTTIGLSASRCDKLAMV
jgi:hypothetical protein